MTFDELIKNLYPDVFRVYDIFINHFGEKYVDLQGIPDVDAEALHNIELYTNIDISSLSDLSESQKMVLNNYFYSKHNVLPIVMVYWPTVIISNEYNDCTTIRDLYAKIEIDTDGCIPADSSGFSLNRSHYSFAEYASDYMHSHTPGIPKGDFSTFYSPCLGTGPIRQTISSLKGESDDATWMLFCRELSLYVTVESLSGGPYRRLKYIQEPKQLRPWDNGYDGIYLPSVNALSRHMSESLVEQFILEYLSLTRISFNFINGRYTINTPFYDFMLEISDAFINFANEHLDERTIEKMWSWSDLVSVIAMNRKFYKVKSSSSYSMSDITRARGQYVCTFKGNRIDLQIDSPISEEIPTTECTILSTTVALGILNRILTIINLKYKNEQFSNNSEKTATSAHKATIYI